jgi:hypothetical protein
LHTTTGETRHAEEGEEKALGFVILSGAKNLSAIQVQKKERFLGEERASE